MSQDQEYEERARNIRIHLFNSELSQREATGLLVIGLLLSVLGILALVVPFLSSMVVNMTVGLLLLVAGLFKLVMTFRERRGRGFGTLLFLSLIYLAAGCLFIGFPKTGLLALTTVLLILFIVEGVALIGFSLLMRPLRRWIWLFISGLLSLLLAILILSGWPLDAYWIPGVIVGIDLLFTGVTFTAFGGALLAGDKE